MKNNVTIKILHFFVDVINEWRNKNDNINAAYTLISVLIVHILSVNKAIYK